MERLDTFLIRKYRKISIESRIAFWSTLVIGLITHGYMFMNKLPNYDDMGVKGFGATFRLGRWFLWFIGAPLYHLELVYSLPWVNGLISLVLVGISVGLICSLYNIRNKISCVIIAGLLISFPSWTGTFFFMFTSIYYAIAVLLGAFSVYCTQKYKRGYIGGIICLVLSAGIYQAYLPYIATLYVILLLQQLQERKNSSAKLIKKAFEYLGILILGVGTYYMISLLCLKVTHQQMANYKGLSEVGSSNMLQILPFLRKVFCAGVSLPFNNTLELSYNLLAKIIYLLLFIIWFVLTTYFLISFGRSRDWGKFCLQILFTICLIIAINGIYIMCPAEGAVYILMTYSYVFICCYPIIMLDLVLKENNTIKCMIATESITLLLGFIMVCNYYYFANAEYLSMDLSLKQAQGYYISMMAQVRNLPGYQANMPIVFVGDSFEDESLYDNEVLKVFELSGRDNILVETNDVEQLLKIYCGFDIVVEVPDTSQVEQALNMPVFPNTGSMKIMNHKVIIKIAEIKKK